MDFTDKKYIIGIDLGTTNCAVSYADLKALNDEVKTGLSDVVKNSVSKDLIKIFQVPQLTGHGEFTQNSVLPSFLYIPGQYDISQESLKHPWKKREDHFSGSFARDHGAKIPARLVSSAKSWLCNPSADRKAKILPWGSQGFEKVSPVTATAFYLEHIRSAWNHYVKDEDSFLENQFVVITVPASFNEEARQLTMEAVQIAGFGPDVILLEEPLAAFYSWLIYNERIWQQTVKPGDLIFICDVGGGTTDFSLISLKESDGSPRFERIAVGDHLILGGDNIDIALAGKAASKFKSSVNLTSDKWKILCYQCRQAKEKIFEGGETSVRITIKGEGRSLIADTLSADLTKDDLEQVIFEQFYPLVEPDDPLQIDEGREMTDFGLPLEKESAVTKHIISFLEKHKDNIARNLSKQPVPDFILFNGGTLKPASVQKRIVEAVGKYFRKEKDGWPVILENKIPEFAVGVGASYYGLAKHGYGEKVGSGSPRNYYIRVLEKNSGTAKAVCIIERGLDEGSDIDLEAMEYEVRTNEPVSFDIYSSSYRSGDKTGDIIDIDRSMVPMSPLNTIIKFGRDGTRKTIPISISARYSEVGTLSMYCNSMVSNHKWELSFQLRDTQIDTGSIESRIFDDQLIDRACFEVEACFENDLNDPDRLKTVVKQIEKLLEQKKTNWPLTLLRKIADTLIKYETGRKISAEHEARWMNLTGFCMRPGFGDAFDEDRIRKLWKIYLSGLAFDKAHQNRLEWWIFIRRIAAGLKAGQQRQVLQDMSPLILKGGFKKLPPHEQIELWMAAGNMERLLVKDKILLSKILMPLLKTNRIQDKALWTLSRLGARDLLYGSADRVVPSREVVKWINQAKKIKWQQKNGIINFLTRAARKTGDRTRDIEEKDQEDIIELMETLNAKSSEIKMITEKTESELEDKNAQFGEKLPAGLILKP